DQKKSFIQSGVSDEYDPLKAGSIDCTDLRPHDRGICRALEAKHIPPKHIKSKPRRSIFVGRLPLNISEDELFNAFDRVASVRSVKVVRDIVTGACQGYAFVELKHERDVLRVLRKCKGISFDGKEALIDREVGRSLKGWVPRRLGGGWGGRKEAGQLRFGCVDRPWKRPIRVHKREEEEGY
ncbi:RNA recognition motif domain, partial [Trinorchestia longiramus]